MCLAGAVVASWPQTQKMASLNAFTVMTNIFVTEFSELSGKFLGKTHLFGIDGVGISGAVGAAVVN